MPLLNGDLLRRRNNSGGVFFPASVPLSTTTLGHNNPIYAQPLYVHGITVQNPVSGTCVQCDMVVVVTAYGSIFAYNADNGNLLWSRTGTGGSAGTNWLWYDDCGTFGGVVGGIGENMGSTQFYIGPGLPFAGIVSTPVIDTSPPAQSPYTATMFLTSLCQTSGGIPQWWLHEIDLTGLSSGHAAGEDISTVQMNPTSGSITFNSANQLQRPALLEIKVAGATPNPLIYVAFGVAGSEITDTPSDVYHGWLLGYTINSSAALVSPPSLTFVTTPTSCGTGGGSTQCSPGNGGTPPCDCLIAGQNAPNWGGFGGGIWMSGRGPASHTDTTGVAHTIVAVGNGGFQTPTSYNWGDSILDFHLSPTGLGTAPSDYFTPYGGPGDCWETNTCSPVIQLPLSLSSCANDKQTDGTCNHTVELLSEKDWDMGISGVTLFAAGASSLGVTLDKAGYGYLFLQDRMKQFQAGDPGNLFPFIGVDTPCTGGADSCDRVTSLAFYNNTLFLWPFQETLRSLQFNGGPTATAGTTIYTDSSGANVTGTGCTGSGSCPCSGGSCFTHTVIPGDWLIANGCTTPHCPIVTSVGSDTTLTVSPPFTPVPASSPVSYSYNGYFINPIHDISPIATHVGYPGGTLAVTSNGTTAGTAVVWSIYGNTGAGGSTEGFEGTGFLRAYDVGNLTAGATLTSLWDSGTAGSSPASFDISRFGVPTIAHGEIFVPTYYISHSSVNSTCMAPTIPPSAALPCLGILVYQGTAVP